MSSTSRPGQWIATWILVGVLLAGAFVAAVFHRPILLAVGAERDGAPATIAPTMFSPEPTTPVEPPMGVGIIGPVDDAVPGTLPDPAALEAALGRVDTTALAAAAEDLQLGYQVVDVETGEVLAERNPDLPLIPASNTKLLTTVAVLAAFDHQDRFVTTVVQPEAGRVVLVGGGDPQLTSAAVDEGAYPQTASLEELAELTAEALLAEGQSSVTLGYDATLFEEEWADTWPSTYHDQVTRLSSLWADEGRGANRVRSTTPALLAATTFAEQLGALGITVTGTPTAEEGAGAEIARVESPALHVLAEQAMLRSNNSFTEVLGFQLALRTGHPATFAGSVAAIEEQLTELGLWEEGAVLHDASGLSRSNLVPAGMLARAVRHAATTPELSIILDGLPVAGVTGTLANRFDDSVSRPARGIARAKTGTLRLVRTLAGTTVTADDRAVAYAFMTFGSSDGWASMVWTDQSVGVVTGCGC